MPAKQTLRYSPRGERPAAIGKMLRQALVEATETDGSLQFPTHWGRLRNTLQPHHSDEQSVSVANHAAMPMSRDHHERRWFKRGVVVPFRHFGPQFSERLILNLPDTFACETKMLPDVLQGSLRAIR